LYCGSFVVVLVAGVDVVEAAGAAAGVVVDVDPAVVVE
jgi:hypothetical protein